MAMSEDKSVMDVAAFTFDDPEIGQYIHHYRKSVLETPSRQRRIARKWKLQRHFLHERMRWPRSQIREWQLNRVATLVDFAFNTIPFYREHYSACGYRTGDILSWDDFACLPVVTRSDLTSKFPAGTVLAGIDPSSCYGARTSGSSGFPLTVVRDDASEELQSLLRMRQFEVMLGEPLSPNEWIYNVYNSSWAFTSFDGAFPVFSISERCPPNIAIRHIAKLRPKVLSAFPSFLTRMSETPHDLSQYGIRCICTNSEGSTRQERSNFASAFDVPVFDEYSTEEFCGVVASECRCGNYHVIDDRIIVEVVNAGEDGVGDMVGTDLSNFYMPFIRYAQGDLIRFAPEGINCACGNNFRHLDRFLGRSDQALVTCSGERVPGDQLMNLLDQTFVDPDSGASAFRLIQTELDIVEVLVVLRSDFRELLPSIAAEFESGLRDLFRHSVFVNYRYVDTLPDTSSYKRRTVINSLNGLRVSSSSPGRE